VEHVSSSSIGAVRIMYLAVNHRHPANRALAMALKRGCPDVGLLHHSDQGSPYASEDDQTILEARGTTCSMSRRGKLLRQRSDGELLLKRKERAPGSLRQLRRGQDGVVRLHRSVL